MIINTAKFIFIIIIGYSIYTTVPYFLADYQYEELTQKNKLLKKDVDNQLFLYTSHEIPIEESLWGNKYKLKTNEYCIQYKILAIEPIDIVYNHANQVIRTYSSYE